MMKNLFMVGVAIAALSSCTQNEVLEVNESKAIGFDAFVGKSTRVTEDVTLDNLGSFDLYGWRGEDQIFTAQEVTVTGDGVCSYSPIQYWEAGFTYNFEAIAPNSSDKGVSFVASKDGGTIVFTNNNGTTDLIYAKASKVEMGETITEAPNAVGLTFSHLLSRVKFTFTNGFPENAAAKITVSNVEITNAYQTASITPATSDWTDHDGELSIDFNSNGIKNLVSSLKEEYQEGEISSAATEHMYLIPYTDPTYTLNFTVTLTQANGVASTYKHTTTLETSMEKGNSYNFTATLDNENVDPDNQLHPIEFKAEETPWEDWSSEDGGVDVTLPDTTTQPEQ